jgi:hypothetical protein
VRILRGRGLQVWLPERENQWPDRRLQVLRGSMQLLSHLQLPDRLGASYRRRAFLLATPGRAPEPKQCAAFLLTRGAESIMYNHSTVPVAREDLKAKRMTGMAASIYFATMLLPAAAIAAPKGGVCGIGTVIDVQAHVEVIQAGAFEHGRETVKKNGRREYYSSLLSG